MTPRMRERMLRTTTTIQQVETNSLGFCGFPPPYCPCGRRELKHAVLSNTLQLFKESIFLHITFDDRD